VIGWWSSASSHKLVVRRPRLKTVWLHLESGMAYFLASPLHSLHRPSKNSWRHLFPTVIYLYFLRLPFLTCSWSFGLWQAKFVVIIIIISDTKWATIVIIWLIAVDVFSCSGITSFLAPGGRSNEVCLQSCDVGICRQSDFYHETLCICDVFAVAWCLSICPTIHHIGGLYPDSWRYHQTYFLAR